MIKNSVFRQYYAAISANFISLGYGLLCGWTSSSFLILQSDKSPLETGPITTEEASWIASILSLGGFFGNIVLGLLADRLGRKMLLLLLAFPQMASIILIMFAKNVTLIYISRFLGGFSGGGHGVLVPLYIIEISEDKIRGSLGSVMVLMTNLGILLGFVFGNYLDYYTLPYIFLLSPILFLIAFLFLPETPHHLLKQQKYEEAEKSLRYFRNVKKLTKEQSDNVKAEMEKLKSTYMENENIVDKEKLSWNDFTNPAARRAILIGVVLMAVNQFSGCFAMVSYTASIFQESGSSLSPNMSAIIVGVILLLGTYVSTFLVEVVGRKFLLGISCIGASLGLATLATYALLKDLQYNMSGFEWIPIVSFSFVLFIASLGILTLPFVVLSELMPPKIRSIGVSFCMSTLWFCAFIMIKYLPLLTFALKMHGLFFFFATVCILGAIFFLIKVPETKGKSLETILKMLEK